MSGNDTATARAAAAAAQAAVDANRQASNLLQYIYTALPFGWDVDEAGTVRSPDGNRFTIQVVPIS